ncbi:hypothetical protein K474DRAFT_1678548 [Panus rudis PR-1116 ss-1]|nr:hypothetical protein K474DRAFT_1678548 [Panus rudis PR-1116 ss-1]
MIPETTHPDRDDETPVDESFYFDDLYISVEGYLYKLPGRSFYNDSIVFRDMRTLPTGESAVVEGSSKDTPLRLDPVKRAEFNPLLRVMFPRNFGVDEELSEAEWISVLKLSNMWEMTRISALATKHLHDLPQRNAAQALALARQHDIKEWMLPALKALAQRHEDITCDDAKILGWELALQVANLRGRAVALVEKYGMMRSHFDYTPSIRQMFHV